MNRAQVDEPKTIHLKDYKRPSFRIPEAEIHFDLNEESTHVHSKLKIQRNHETFASKQPLVLNGENLKLISVRMNGEVLSERDFKITESAMEITPVAENFILEIETEIKPHLNQSLEGLYKSGEVFCTQNESEGFRKITYFLDRPDVMSRFTTTITADKKKYPVLLSNGNLIEKKDLAEGRHFVKWQDPFPKPCYLFALVAGNLGMIHDAFKTKSGRKIALQIYVDKGNEKKATYAMDCLKKAMKWDEETFNLEYDLDLYMIVAVDAFNFGAMENKGLNIFNSQCILADQETATDQNFLGILGVIGHEYFHNWTGNRVTCRDWFQITLKEGLTILRDQEFSADMTSRPLKRIEDVRVIKDYQFAEDAGPNRHPIRPSSYMEVGNFYTTTVYQKGSEVLRMIMTLIGRENFKKGMAKYFELYDGQAVTTENLIHAMEIVSGLDLTQFRNWYDFPGTPVCKVKSRYDEKAKVFELIIEQESPRIPEGVTIPPFYFPFTVALLDQNGEEMKLEREDANSDGQREQVLHISEKKHVFRFKNISSKPIPSLLRNFSAPVKLATDLRDEDLLFLLSHDTDPVNRYDAGQTLARRELLQGIRQIQKKSKYEPDSKVLDAFGSFLKDEIDPAFAAEALSPPSEASLSEDLEICDFEAVHKARDLFMKALVLKFRGEFERVYEKLQQVSGVFQIDPASIGKRAFKNTALYYLILADPERYALWAWKQFQDANNMTDSITALGILCETESEQKKNVLSIFYHRWKSNPLVMNKWFAVQSGSRQGDVLAQVKILEKDFTFDLKNPNKQRALFGIFVGNLIHFHEPSGKGYRFIGDKIVEIDGFNPSAAAKLSACFKKYKKLDSGRQKLMETVLQKILAHQGLSKETYEIVSKTLKS